MDYKHVIQAHHRRQEFQKDIITRLVQIAIALSIVVYLCR